MLRKQTARSNGGITITAWKQKRLKDILTRIEHISARIHGATIALIVLLSWICPPRRATTNIETGGNNFTATLLLKDRKKSITATFACFSSNVFQLFLFQLRNEFDTSYQANRSQQRHRACHFLAITPSSLELAWQRPQQIYKLVAKWKGKPPTLCKTFFGCANFWVFLARKTFYVF